MQKKDNPRQMLGANHGREVPQKNISFASAYDMTSGCWEATVDEIQMVGYAIRAGLGCAEYMVYVVEPVIQCNDGSG